MREHAGIIVNDDIAAGLMASQMTLDLGATNRKIRNLLLREEIGRAPIDEIAVLPDTSLSQYSPVIRISAPCACDN